MHIHRTNDRETASNVRPARTHPLLSVGKMQRVSVDIGTASLKTVA